MDRTGARLSAPTVPSGGLEPYPRLFPTPARGDGVEGVGVGRVRRRHGDRTVFGVGAPATESGTEKLVIQRIVDLPSDQFLELMHQHFAEKRMKAPLQPGEVIDVEAQVHEAVRAE